MKDKGLLLVFISDYKENASVSKYKVKREGEEDLWFEGAQTNDAPVKYLLLRALEEGSPIRKIICIVSQKVEDKGYKEFQSMVSDHIGGSEELKAVYSGQPMDFHTVRYPEDEEKISDRAAQVYRQIAAEDCIGGENGARVYIDYTGGLRDINFLMTAIIRYLEYRGASCREIVYSSFNRDNREKNEICSLGCIYDMYQLLNGVQQFVDTGNAELLSSQEEAQNSRQNQGKTWRTEYFYGPFYDQLVMRDFKEFVERLKAGDQDMRDTYPLLEQSEADRFWKLKDYMKTPQEKKAVDRLIAFLKRHYGGVPREIIHPYTDKKM